MIADQNHGTESSTLTRTLAAAAARPGDVGAQITAAYACDRAGKPEDAIEFYQQASTLGIPLEGRRVFLTGYGASLMAAGRYEQSAAILEQALQEFPDDSVLRILEALSMHHAGRADAAVASLLHVLLTTPQPSSELDRYRPGLEGYRDELRARAEA